ncbi:MAG TPA: hypothetical protein VLD39_08530 [Gammaproteobacteria bacterium]|nr:hypothetical protein [Gammaproteobacteria bacterium]
MDLETSPRDTQTGKLLFNSSEEWLRAGEHGEPDLAVDGLRGSSLLARFLGRLFKKR